MITVVTEKGRYDVWLTYEQRPDQWIKNMEFWSWTARGRVGARDLDAWGFHMENAVARWRFAVECIEAGFPVDEYLGAKVTPLPADTSAEKAR